jgi:alcohol dehydrogenase class IV
MEFRFYSPTEIRFGAGRLHELGKSAERYGSKALLVSGQGQGYRRGLETACDSLQSAGVEVTRYDKVTANPTLAAIQEGAELARTAACDVVVAVGGGSAIDTGKGIAVAATHPGSAWDYLYFREQQPTAATLPIIAVPTTSGTGSHVTRVSVFTDAASKNKSAIGSDYVFPRCAIVDPTLMVSMPKELTACTGFDAFSHAFESYINVSATPATDLLAMEAMRLIAQYLPAALADGEDIEARSQMAWADTLAGMCISNAGTTLPHAMGQPISGHYPQVSHAESLAVVYPAFLEYTAGAAPERFIAVGKLFEPHLTGSGDKGAQEAVQAIEGFIQQIGMWRTLAGLGVEKQELEAILSDCMSFPDVRANPRVPNRERTRELYLERFD